MPHGISGIRYAGADSGTLGSMKTSNQRITFHFTFYKICSLKSCGICDLHWWRLLCPDCCEVLSVPGPRLLYVFSRQAVDVTVSLVYSVLYAIYILCAGASHRSNDNDDGNNYETAVYMPTIFCVFWYCRGFSMMVCQIEIQLHRCWEYIPVILILEYLFPLMRWDAP